MAKQKAKNNRAQATQISNKKDSSSTLMGIILWITGILVSLAVGFGMISRTLTVPFIPTIITVIAGWIVVIGSIISLIMAIFNK